MSYLILLVIYQAAFSNSIDVEPISGATLYEQNNPFEHYQKQPGLLTKTKKETQATDNKEDSKDSQKDYTDDDNS